MYSVVYHGFSRLMAMDMDNLMTLDLSDCWKSLGYPKSLRMLPWQDIGEIRVSPCESIFAIGGNERFRFFRLEDASPLRDLSKTIPDVTDFAFADAGTVLVAYEKSNLSVLDLGTGEISRRLSQSGETIGTVSVTPDGRYGVVGRAGNLVEIWNLKSGRRVELIQDSAPETTTSASAIPSETRGKAPAESCGFIHQVAFFARGGKVVAVGDDPAPRYLECGKLAAKTVTAPAESIAPPPPDLPPLSQGHPGLPRELRQVELSSAPPAVEVLSSTPESLEVAFGLPDFLRRELALQDPPLELKECSPSGLRGSPLEGPLSDISSFFFEGSLWVKWFGKLIRFSPGSMAPVSEIVLPDPRKVAYGMGKLRFASAWIDFGFSLGSAGVLALFCGYDQNSRLSGICVVFDPRKPTEPFLPIGEIYTTSVSRVEQIDSGKFLIVAETDAGAACHLDEFLPVELGFILDLDERQVIYQKKPAMPRHAIQTDFVRASLNDRLILTTIWSRSEGALWASNLFSGAKLGSIPWPHGDKKSSNLVGFLAGIGKSKTHRLTIDLLSVPGRALFSCRRIG